MSHLGGATGDGIEHLEGAHQLTGAIDLHFQPSAGELANQLRQPVRAGAQSGEVLGPCGHHLPLDGLTHRHGGHRLGAFLTLAAGAEGGGRRRTCQRADQFSAFHADFLL